MMFAVWVAPACFIFRHVFCFASFLLLACLRMSCYGMVYGRSGMLSFPTCFLLRLVCSTGLFTHVMFRHVLWSLRHVLFSDMFSASLRLFCWLVCARPVPAFFMVAPACGIYRYVFCMCIFRHVSSFCVFRHVWFSGMFKYFLLSACYHFHSHLRPGTCLRLCRRYGRQGRRHVYLPSSSPRFMFRHVSSVGFFRHVCFSGMFTYFLLSACCIPHTIAARCWSCLWSLR